ncbi:MAG: RluA family pseudouridine synthase [Thermodesulforhabdaceae bacterium]
MMDVSIEKANTRLFVIQDEAHNRQRLDVFLAGVLDGYSRSGVQKLIESGHVKVNGRSQKASYQLRIGDVVYCELFLLSEPSSPVIEPVYIPLDILYEDECIIVVNKPAGLVVHPGAGQSDKTLVHGLLYHCGKLASIGAPLRPGIVHRLDQGTSGVMVVAKTDKAYLNLIEQFKSHTVEKVYLAVLWGVPSSNSSPIVTLMDRHPVNRKKMAVSKFKGREAITYWKILKDWNRFSLVEARPVTGRTHQIRVHFSYIQHPIVGDELYSNFKNRCRNLKDEVLRKSLEKVSRQMLHAAYISFKHPCTGERLHFDAPIPEDMAELTERIASRACVA